MNLHLEKKLRSKSDDQVFSILIPTWNNLPYLRLCIESLLKNSTFHHQIIVMINEGTDGSKEYVESHEELDYVYCPQNIGICYGLNILRSLILTDYVLYANDDMYFTQGWDEPLVREIKTIGHPWFMISGTMIERCGDNPCCVIADYGDAVETFDEERLTNDLPRLRRGNWAGSTWPPNVTSLDVWDLIGGMSPEFSPGMYSDPDMAMKMWNLGVRIFYGVGDSLVYHFGCKSTKRIRRNKGADTFLRKWGMTSGSLFKYFLRRGENYDKPLDEGKIPFFRRMKERLKKLFI